MAEVNDPPEDIGQAVQPNMTIGAGDDPERNERAEDAVSDRLASGASEGDGGGTDWAQSGDDESLRGPETLDDAGASR